MTDFYKYQTPAVTARLTITIKLIRIPLNMANSCLSTLSAFKRFLLFISSASLFPDFTIYDEIIC